jgi:SPP1 gp7 family putative phage head morphogenesis protein
MTRSTATVTQYAQSQIYPIITSGQVAAITMAERHAQTSLIAALGTTPLQVAQAGVVISRLPVGAMNAMVGRLADGSPLSRLLAELGPEASNAIKGVLLKGVAQGYNPRKVAREMRKSLGGNMSRALRISRNEQLRAYREASLEAYRQNEGLVHGWLWIASLSPRTCPLCIAEHGSFHPLNEPFASHISCRCSPVPWTKSFAELGIEGVPDTRPPLPESGESWFARQSPQYQESLLGPGKYEAYRAGQIQLSDLVGRRNDPNWGPSRYVKSLDAAIGR